jgi:hypothetical protein
MVSLIQQSLEVMISKHGFFNSALTRTEDVYAVVSFILQSLELRISKQWFILSNSH